MSYDPNQPQQPDPNQQPQSPYGQSQPPYQQPQPPYEQQQWGQQPPPYYEQPGQPQQAPHGQQQPPPYAPTQYIAPAYGAPPVPGYLPPQQPRRSRSGLWIALGIIGGVLLLICALCGILIARGVGPLASIVGSIAGPTTTVSQYYNAVEKQDYSTAFSYISTNSTVQNSQIATQDLYTAAAQAVDTAKGKVSSFSIGNISLTNNNNTAIVTVAVTRGNSSAYDVHLQLEQVNGSWKITMLDNI